MFQANSAEICVLYCKLDQFQKIREIKVCHMQKHSTKRLRPTLSLLPMKTLKNTLKSSTLYGPIQNFQYYQNHPKSHILFNRNGSPRHLYVYNDFKQVASKK